MADTWKVSGGPLHGEEYAMTLERGQRVDLRAPDGRTAVYRAETVSNDIEIGGASYEAVSERFLFFVGYEAPLA